MRIIGHLDMDAFFAAVEERDKEWLRGFPIVVGADPKEGAGRGVVSTANYKAREYGIKSAMPISRAWQLSEDAKKKGRTPAVFLGGSFEKYAEVSSKIMTIIRSFSDAIEEASVDEAYFDLSHCGSYENAAAIAENLKREIVKKENLTASVGIGPNKLIAKIASDMKKPDGLTVVHEESAGAFLEPLLLRKIPGIGPKTELELKKIGASTVRDLRRLSSEELKEILGKWGPDLYRKIRAEDDSPIVENYEIKSIGEQETFSENTLNPQMLTGALECMCVRILQKVKHDGFWGFKTIEVTVRFHDFDTKSRAHTLIRATDSPNIFKFETLKLFLPFLDHRENPREKNIRLVGVRVQKLC